MKLSNDVYKNILDNLYDGVYILDHKMKIVYWNKGAEKLTGYMACEVIGRSCSDNILSHVNEKGINLCLSELCPARSAMKLEKMCEKELYIHHKNGHRVSVTTRVGPVYDSKDKVIGAVEIFSDSSSKIMAQKRIDRLSKMALLDPLTELGNKRFVNINLHSRLNELARYGWPFGILFVDIDHFKEINDRYGHDVGDRVLKMVANTLLRNSRTFDAFCRWGGEEFVGIISNVKEGELFLIADRFRVLVEKSSLNVGKDLIRVTVSIGAAVAQPDDTIESLLKKADRMVYRSKEAGANRVSMK